MSDIKGGLVILKDMVNHLPASERKIAEYILNNPEESIRLTAMALGQRSRTSSAAVIRLCKSLGFDGFQELKIRVAGDLQGNIPKEYRDIEPNEPFGNIIDQVTSNTIQTIKETADILSKEKLMEATQALSRARTIVCFGVGASYLAAHDAEQKFLRVNKTAYSFSDVQQAATLIANKGPDDVVIGISFSGQTDEVARLLKFARHKGITTIGITKLGQSPVNEHSDIQLYTSAAKEAPLRSGATSSRMAQLYVIDVLFMCLASREYEQSVKYLDETLAAIRYLKDRDV